MRLLLTARGRAGICPRQGTFFSLLAQRKEGKRKGTLLAGRPRADCSALLVLGGSRPTHYAACGRCVQTGGAKSEDEACCARSPQALRCSARPKGKSEHQRGLAAHRPERLGFALAPVFVLVFARRPPTVRAEVSKPCSAQACTGLRYRSLSGGRASRCMRPGDAKRAEAKSSAVAAGVRPILWHAVDRPRPVATQFGQMKSAFALVTFIWRDK